MKIIDVKAGDRLVADGGFTCIRNGQVGTVVRTKDGALAIPCDAGLHCLDGQTDEAGNLIGLVHARLLAKEGT